MPEEKRSIRYGNMCLVALAYVGLQAGHVNERPILPAAQVREWP